MKGFIKRLAQTSRNASAKCFIIVKITFFSLLLACSSFSIAQESNVEITQSVELEQVNINQADAQDIAQALSGIGIKKAEAIVAYRDENGAYNNVDDLIMVKGIGEFTILKNEERIVFD